MKKKLILYTLIGTIVFGVIDASLFIGGEAGMDSWLSSFTFIDNFTAPLIVGGLSASISLFICNTVNKLLKNKYHIDLIDSPLLDVFGILIGTFIVIIFYYNFMKHRYKDKPRK